MATTTTKATTGKVRGAADVLRDAAIGWKRYGCLPSEVEVRDWKPLDIPQCDSRWVVVVTFAGRGDSTEFLCECDTEKDAKRTAARYQRFLESEFDRA
jgi:hypothetical protein